MQLFKSETKNLFPFITELRTEVVLILFVLPYSSSKPTKVSSCVKSSSSFFLFSPLNRTQQQQQQQQTNRDRKIKVSLLFLSL